MKKALWLHEGKLHFEREAASEGFSEFYGYHPSYIDPKKRLECRNIVYRTLRNINERADKEKRVLDEHEEKAWSYGTQFISEIEECGMEPVPQKLDGKFMARLLNANSHSGDGHSKTGRAMIDKEGREHRVYAHGENMSTAHGSYDDGFDLGSIIRSKVCGPRSDVDERALAGGTDSAGGYTVPHITSERFIDKMRAQSSCINAGAQTILLETDKTTFARLKGDPGIEWKPENAKFNPNDPVFDAVQFNAKTLFCIVPISIELFQDTLNADAAVSRAISQKFAEELDRVALVGSGIGSEPTGLKNQAGIGTYEMAANGSALTDYDPVIMAIRQLHEANAKNPTAAIMAPRTFQSFGVLKDTQGRYLDRPGTIRDLPFLVTSQLPLDEVQGTSTAASSIFVGDFSDLWIGIRFGLTIKILTERYADYGQVGIMAIMRCDTQLAQPRSFCRISGVL